MAHSRENPNADLRDALHADLCDFVEGIEANANAQGDTALATEVRRVHQAKLDALMNDEEVKGIPRWDLPLWHAESTTYGGNPNDRFTLTADDRLIPDTVTPKFVPPGNRKQRRANGQRGHKHNGNDPVG